MANHNKRLERINVEKYNYQNCIMKCIQYNHANDIIVEFQDNYKGKVHSHWNNFEVGSVKNPYYPEVCNVGMCGNKYPIRDKNSGKITQEYYLWSGMIKRCFDLKTKQKNSAYQDVTCCKEWLLYENFYEWLHSQENFDKWLNGKLWALDKDILIKGNRIYSPSACCLVPKNVNNLFLKSNKTRGDYPIGVSYKKDDGRFYAKLSKQENKIPRTISQGGFPTPKEAFYLGYKPAKEAYIKQIAKEEFDKGNITKKCYEAMMKYEVEITD